MTDPARHFWSELFGNTLPVEVEIGSGDGTFLAHAARTYPQTNFLGIERAGGKARRMAHRVASLDTPRVRALYADATCVIRHLVPPASVAAYHLYFPDPWPKARHARRRIVTPEFIDAVACSLEPGGRWYLATDVYGYLHVMRGRIVAFGGFDEQADLPSPGMATAFARKYHAAGRPLFATTFVRKAG